MNGKWGYGILVAFAAVMIGLLIVEGRPQPPATAEDTVALFRLFPEIDTPDRIIGMEVTNPVLNRQVAIVVEDDQQTWRMRDEPFTVLDPEQANTARYYLGLLPTAGTLDSGDVPETGFGFLPNPQLVVRFQLEDLSVATLYVGNTNPEGDLYYVSSQPKGDIVDLVPVDWLDTYVNLMVTLKPADAQADNTPTPIPR